MFKKLMNNRQSPFWLIAFSLLTGLTLPTLIKDGMFMDAMLYTCVSHNLSMGIGTFWFPQFSVHNVAGLSSFHEQPPLVFGIQSIFYMIFGNSMYVERFYTFLTMCITAILINQLWEEIYNGNSKLKKLGWLPIILWITIPVCFWSYSNNMQENTMGIFTLFAVFIIYKSLRAGLINPALWIFSGVFIFLATLSKGLPGLFPITVPFLYWLTNKRIRFSRILLQTFFITLIPLIIYGILFLFPESKESLSIYFLKRALHRINDVPTVGSRFYILFRLLMELLPQILLVGLFVLISRIKRIKIILSEQIHESVFFLLVGLSASLPLMLTLVQKGFYFVPALPFFAIGLSILIVPVILNLTERIITKNKRFRIVVLLSLLLFIGTTSFAMLQKGKTSRNKELLHDVYLIGKIVPRQATVTIPITMWDEWDLQCYLMRYFNISLETSETNSFYIIRKSINLDTLSDYTKAPLPTLEYELYKRQNISNKNPLHRTKK